MGKPESGRIRYTALETGLLQAKALRKYLDNAVIPIPDPDQPHQNYLERLVDREALIKQCITLEEMENETNKLLWWGYLHQFGTYHVKRYFNDPADLQEARESDFVSAVHGPFEAKDRQEALIILQKELK